MLELLLNPTVDKIIVGLLGSIVVAVFFWLVKFIVKKLNDVPQLNEGLKDIKTELTSIKEDIECFNISIGGLERQHKELKGVVSSLVKLTLQQEKRLNHLDDNERLIVAELKEQCVASGINGTTTELFRQLGFSNEK